MERVSKIIYLKIEKAFKNCFMEKKKMEGKIIANKFYEYKRIRLIIRDYKKKKNR